MSWIGRRAKRLVDIVLTVASGSIDPADYAGPHSTAVGAYEAAIRRRDRTGDRSEDNLRDRLYESGLGEAYTERTSPEAGVLFEAWAEGAAPGEVRKRLGRLS
ncbi:hypothetical protein FE697_021270 [Mumia zhuanghuii]|uniref:Uncharacterized protein n=2 Tax=Mumia TaxID=1546255 RepID=A0ABW1QL54_9ACTN|nr:MULTISPECIES: hypothetical protein [Mumia]KAA1418353.1 hypothetical protein FE697_021270 [Mumia zhuanghuii]